MTLHISDNQLNGVRIPAPHDAIYKDECVFSFDNPDSTNGLYISLTSFLGFGEDYYQLYHEKTKHAVFLNHKRTKREMPVKEEEPEKKITRMAIGVEGGFTADSGPKYEYTDHYKIVVLPGPYTAALNDPGVPGKVRESADAVIAATSNFRMAEIEALETSWDGEIRKVSVHSENLLQLDNGVRVPTAGWKCEKCDLTKNLWLNLSDGSILCGRRNHDGSGGNNHGVEHYQELMRYPLAVKLGTITPDGKADIFSYDEDDLVVDPNLSKHLAHFGINIGQLEKTDKSMAELEIELNKKLGEWETCQESGEALVPVYGPGRTGLVNLGNTCYLNSMMQVIFSIPPIARQFVDEFPRLVKNCDFRDPTHDFQLQMAKLGFALASGLYSQPPADGSSKEQPGISPRMFKIVAAAGNRQFLSASQQDAQEYFLHLINVLEKNKRQGPNPFDVFKYKIEDKYQCSESLNVRYTERTEYCLPLPVPLEEAINKAEVEEYERKKTVDPRTELVRSKILFQSCLDALTQSEVVEEFYSSAIKKRTTAFKSTRLSTFPDYLMVHLKKFAAVNGLAVKLDVAVDMPDELDLEQLRGFGLQPGEQVLPPCDEPPVELNQQVLSTLLSMGYPEEQAKKAVFFTKGVGLEPAMDWYDLHINDPDFQSPFCPPGAKQSTGDINVNQESLSFLLSMGYGQEQCIKALKETDNNVDRALDWVLSHPDYVGEAQPPPQAAEVFSDGQPKYKLRAFITHMGTSATVGHYVCHILLDDQWVIFNDNKVALSINPPKELAYLYLYQRV